MSATFWVCKADGTIQCQDNPEVPLDVMRLELASIIGESEILNGEKRSHAVARLCGLPTGRVNAYEVTERGYHVLFRGFTGPRGFTPCDGHQATSDARTSARMASDKSNDEVGFGAYLAESKASSVISVPTQIKELIGRPLRVYATGDALTLDYRPERVNIEIGPDGERRIVDVWFG